MNTSQARQPSAKDLGSTMIIVSMFKKLNSSWQYKCYCLLKKNRR